MLSSSTVERTLVRRQVTLALFGEAVGGRTSEDAADGVSGMPPIDDSAKERLRDVKEPTLTW